MDSIYLSRAVKTPPDTPEDVAPGYPTDGSSSSGTDATVPGAYWYNSVTQEIQNVIKGGSITPDRHDLSQMIQAIRALIKVETDARAAALAQMQAKVAQVEVVPSGMIMFFPNPRAPNGNWLICNGQNVSRTAYANLFRVIGTRYGAGNGSTTFTLPNLIDRVPWGGQNNAGEYRNAGLPNIWGRFGADDRMTNVMAGAFYVDSWGHPTGSQRSESGASVTFDARRSSLIYGNSNTVQPPALVLLPCIHI